MHKFMIFTFLMLGWTFYEMSGGADFQAQTHADVVAARDAESGETAPAPAVTRSNATVSLVNVELPLGKTRSLSAQPAVAAASEETPVTQAGFAVTPARATTAADVTETVGAAPLEQIDLREVGGSWVNMRAGPGTSYAVLDTLPEGTRAEVIEVNAAGWAEIRILDTGLTGWMAERLLRDS